MRRILSLCSGIGVLEYGLERAGLGRVSAQAEIDPYCRQVLAKHYPDATRLEDVRVVTLESVGPADVVCGGFPCQPFSVAGKRQGQRDERHIWPEFTRILAEIKPAIGVFENVPGLRTCGLRDVLADLASLGFDVEWCCFGASDLGAPHHRRRIYIVCAHPDRIDVREQPGWLSRAVESARAPFDRCSAEALIAADANHPPGRHVQERHADAARLGKAVALATQRGWSGHCGWAFDPFAPVDDGFTARLAGQVGKARKALGNAVVLPAAELVGRATVAAIGGVR